MPCPYKLASPIISASPYAPGGKFGKTYPRYFLFFSYLVFFPVTSILLSLFFSFVLLTLAPFYLSSPLNLLLPSAFILYFSFLLLLDTRASDPTSNLWQRVFEVVFPGSSYFHFVRNLTFWKLGAAILPARLHKTHDLPSDCGPFLFACFPHGILSLGSQTALGCNALGFDDLFPGVKVHLLGNSPIFKIPFAAEWFLLNCCQSTAKESFRATLGKCRESVSICPGGVREALLAKQDGNGVTLEDLEATVETNLKIATITKKNRMIASEQNRTITLVVKNRTGFVREAILNRAALVPVFTFEENLLYRCSWEAPNDVSSSAEKKTDVIK